MALLGQGDATATARGMKKRWDIDHNCFEDYSTTSMASKDFSLRHLLSGKYQKLTQASSPSRPEISYRFLDKTKQPENMLMVRVAKKMWARSRLTH